MLTSCFARLLSSGSRLLQGAGRFSWEDGRARERGRRSGNARPPVARGSAPSVFPASTKEKKSLLQKRPCAGCRRRGVCFWESAVVSRKKVVFRSFWTWRRCAAASRYTFSKLKHFKRNCIVFDQSDTLRTPTCPIFHQWECRRAERARLILRWHSVCIIQRKFIASSGASDIARRLLHRIDKEHSERGALHKKFVFMTGAFHESQTVFCSPRHFYRYLCPDARFSRRGRGPLWRWNRPGWTRPPQWRTL